MLLRCAMMNDFIEPCATLCKDLQEEEVCVVSVINALVKAAQSLDAMKSTNLSDLPTVKKILSRIKEQDTETTYQGVHISKLTEAKRSLVESKNSCTESICLCLKNCINDRNSNLLTAIATSLATHGWKRTDFLTLEAFPVEALASRFEEPLKSGGMDQALLLAEWHVMIDYAKQYLNLTTDHYCVIWWHLFSCADAVKWSNVLLLVELVFSLPISNCAVERVFSRLNCVKSNRRCNLTEERPDDLIHIGVNGVALCNWNPTNAIQLWWCDKQRRSSKSKLQSMDTVESITKTIESEIDIDSRLIDFGDWDKHFR